MSRTPKSAIDKLQEKIEQLRDSIDYYDRLFESLGNLQEWSFVRMEDAGHGATYQIDPPRCACGHPIRYIFIIQHPQKGQSQVGSECIHKIGVVNFGLAVAMQQRLDEYLAAERIERLRIKQLKQDAEITELTKVYDNLLLLIEKAYRSYRERRLWAPYEIWKYATSLPYGSKLAECYKTKTGLLKALKRYNNQLREIVGMYQLK